VQEEVPEAFLTKNSISFSFSGAYYDWLSFQKASAVVIAVAVAAIVVVGVLLLLLLSLFCRFGR
jgi:hypothetical protein